MKYSSQRELALHRLTSETKNYIYEDWLKLSYTVFSSLDLVWILKYFGSPLNLAYVKQKWQRIWSDMVAAYFCLPLGWFPSHQKPIEFEHHKIDQTVIHVMLVDINCTIENTVMCQHSLRPCYTHNNIYYMSFQAKE